MPILPEFATALRKELMRELKAMDIHAAVDFKVLGRTRVMRMYVVSDDFDAMRYSERQELIWRLVRDRLKPAELNRISMIVTATREEVEDDEESPSFDVPKRRSVHRHRDTRLFDPASGRKKR